MSELCASPHGMWGFELIFNWATKPKKGKSENRSLSISGVELQGKVFQSLHRNFGYSVSFNLAIARSYFSCQRLSELSEVVFPRMGFFLLFRFFGIVFFACRGRICSCSPSMCGHAARHWLSSWMLWLKRIQNHIVALSCKKLYSNA